jgi:hypothetical protein
LNSLYPYSIARCTAMFNSLGPLPPSCNTTGSSTKRLFIEYCEFDEIDEMGPDKDQFK